MKRQTQVRWPDIRVGERFRFWGSSVPDFTWVKVSTTTSVRVGDEDAYRKALTVLSVCPEDLLTVDLASASVDVLTAYGHLRQVCTRPVEDRTERYGVLRDLAVDR